MADIDASEVHEPVDTETDVPDLSGVSLADLVGCDRSALGHALLRVHGETVRPQAAVAGFNSALAGEEPAPGEHSRSRSLAAASTPRSSSGDDAVIGSGSAS